MAIRTPHDFFGAARIEIGAEEKIAKGQAAPFSYRTIRLYPADGGPPTEITVFGEFSGILVTEEKPS